MATITLDEETKLIKAAIAGDELAFATLYTAYADVVRRAVASIVAFDQVDDLVQETFLRVHQNLHTFKGDAKFTTWVHRIAVNQALQHLRSKAGSQERQTSSLDETHDDGFGNIVRVIEPGFEDRTIAANEAHALVHGAMDTLKPKHREIVALILEGYGGVEIAEMIGEPITKVKARVHRAKHALRAELQRRQGTLRQHASRSYPVGIQHLEVIQLTVEDIDQHVRATLSAKKLSMDAETAICA